MGILRQLPCIRIFSMDVEDLVDASIRHMRVPLWPIRRAGSWGYLAGSWREATPNVIIILIDIRENETIMFG